MLYCKHNLPLKVLPLQACFEKERKNRYGELFQMHLLASYPLHTGQISTKGILKMFKIPLVYNSVQEEGGKEISGWK